MTEVGAVGGVAAGEVALRLSALRGTATYAAYLADGGDMERAVTDLADEIREAAPDAQTVRLSPDSGDRLVAELAMVSAEIVLVDTHAFGANDWALLDRRRSSMAHRGVLVLVLTHASFNDLMRNAPNLASWLGGEVFAYPRNDATIEAHRAQRIAALRAWSGRTDEDVITAARAGSLPLDPEYAEWLALLGHGELINSGS